MKTKYCKLCSPEKWMIEDDSPVAVGYYLKGKRKIPVCELCASGQSNYFEIIYYEKRIEKAIEICTHNISNYRKKNLVTISDILGGHDIMVCEICGHEIKRYNIGGC